MKRWKGEVGMWVQQWVTKKESSKAKPNFASDSSLISGRSSAPLEQDVDQLWQATSLEFKKSCLILSVRDTNVSQWYKFLIRFMQQGNWTLDCGALCLTVLPADKHCWTRAGLALAILVPYVKLDCTTVMYCSYTLVILLSPLVIGFQHIISCAK